METFVRILFLAILVETIVHYVQAFLGKRRVYQELVPLVASFFLVIITNFTLGIKYRWPIIDILLLALLIEQAVHWAKGLLRKPEHKEAIAFIAFLFFTIFFALTELDRKWASEGIVSAAIVISRFANFIHDFFGLIDRIFRGKAST